MDDQLNELVQMCDDIAKEKEAVMHKEQVIGAKIADFLRQHNIPENFHLPGLIKAFRSGKSPLIVP